MAQLLALINKRHPRMAQYQFGAREQLIIHTDGNADICDAATGACIRSLKWDGVRNMGYCPFKLLAGNVSDQLMEEGRKI